MFQRPSEKLSSNEIGAVPKEALQNNMLIAPNNPHESYLQENWSYIFSAAFSSNCESLRAEGLYLLTLIKEDFSKLHPLSHTEGTYLL